MAESCAGWKPATGFIDRAEPQFKMAKVAGHGYYGTLREKLGWGGSNRSRNTSNLI